MPSATERALASGNELLRDVAAGLGRKPKVLPPKYFYDERGSELFAEITRLPEYYLTRSEQLLLHSFAAPWLAARGVQTLVELGAGNAEKTRALLDALPAGATYIPVDISSDFLATTADRLSAEYPHLRIRPLVADMTNLPAIECSHPAVFAFLGSTIGNFEEPDAVTLLAQVRRAMQPGDALLLGADLVKDAATLELAYNDAAGVTEAFNLNVLRVLNRRLGADFDHSAFRHVAFYDDTHRRIEMHLVSLSDQVVKIPGWRAIRLRRGETIRTEVSCKYHRTTLERMLTAAGLEVRAWRAHDDPPYALAVAEPRLPASSRPAPRTHEQAVAWVRQHLVPRPTPQPRIGVEYEVLVQHASDHRPALWDDGEGALAAWLAAHAAAHRWLYAASGKGAPKYRLPRGGTVTLEPGGQLEYSTPPHGSADAVIADLEQVITALEESAADTGLLLVAAGVDPHNPLEHAPLQFTSDRYRRMDAHFARISNAGAVMMRQTASLQLNLDINGSVEESWRLANALPPYLVAKFANSGRYAGHAAEARSERARIWSMLDPMRTGLFPAREDPAVEYAAFAMAAPAMLHDGEPFAHGEYDEAAWRDHLSTLFPEVRLRGYLELRTLDALPLDRAADAIRLVCRLFWDEAARRHALAVLGPPDARVFERAWREGLPDLPDL